MSNRQIPRSVDSVSFADDNDYFYWNIYDSCRSQFWDNNISAIKKQTVTTFIMSLGAEFFRQSQKPWKLAMFDFSFWFSPFQIIKGKISPYFVRHEEDLVALGTVTKRVIFTLQANRQISRQFFISNKTSLLTYSTAINCGNWLMVFYPFWARKDFGC